MNLSKLPTSPDGTDWGIYGDTPREQWAGVLLEAETEDIERTTGAPAWYTRPASDFGQHYVGDLGDV